MSKFKTWWKTQCPPEDPFIEPNIQDTWIAALKWVLRIPTQDGGNIEYYISKELEAIENE